MWETAVKGKDRMSGGLVGQMGTCDGKIRAGGRVSILAYKLKLTFS